MNRPTRTGSARSARFVLSAASAAGGLLFALTLGGCPYGAELENPERFPKYIAGAGGSAAGAPPLGGMGGGAVAGAPAGGAAPVAGTGNFGCDVTEALTKSCGRTGCHSAASHYANLTLVDPAAIAAQMVGVPAAHGDIDCDPAATFRACGPTELPAGCPPAGLMLLDPNPANFDTSWAIQKLDPAYALECGIKMPAPPGDSATNGWSEERRQCLLNFFRSLVPAQ